MVDFTATRQNRHLANRLDITLNGRGAFRRFKDVLFEWPDDGSSILTGQGLGFSLGQRA
jgi:hypothetical protein